MRATAGAGGAPLHNMPRRGRAQGGRRPGTGLSHMERFAWYGPDFSGQPRL